MNDTQKTDYPSFSGTLLIAMPDMEDDRFVHSLVYIFEHSEKGAMGVVINKKMGEVSLADLLEQLEIKIPEKNTHMDVHYGGPVETERGFVIHSTDVTVESSFFVDKDLAVTSTFDILKSLATDKGPSKALFALGYAGWTPGQLEEEIKHNAWLTIPATPDLIFTDAYDKAAWEQALQSVGISSNTMVSGFGTA